MTVPKRHPSRFSPGSTPPKSGTVKSVPHLLLQQISALGFGVALLLSVTFCTAARSLPVVVVATAAEPSLLLNRAPSFLFRVGPGLHAQPLRGLVHRQYKQIHYTERAAATHRRTLGCRASGHFSDSPLLSGRRPSQLWRLKEGVPGHRGVKITSQNREGNLLELGIKLDSGVAEIEIFVDSLGFMGKIFPTKPQNPKPKT
ncbi:hypothetical protein FF1_030088 [Malus domestica]